jgi:hypothetical protein
MRSITFIVVLILSQLNTSAQSTPEELFNLLRAKDSLLFTASFSNCDMSQLEKLVSTDFEFYHDRGGITPSKEKFIESIRNGLCKDTANYRSRRELIPGTLQVFPMRFYETIKGQPEKPGSTARFTHLWLLEFNEWKLARVLSYDHMMK